MEGGGRGEFQRFWECFFIISHCYSWTKVAKFINFSWTDFFLLMIFLINRGFPYKILLKEIRPGCLKRMQVCIVYILSGLPQLCHNIVKRGELEFTQFCRRAVSREMSPRPLLSHSSQLFFCTPKEFRLQLSSLLELSKFNFHRIIHILSSSLFTSVGHWTPLRNHI